MTFFAARRRFILTVLFAPAVLAFAGCGGSKSDRQTDFDPDADFSKYKTYSFKPGKLSGVYANDPFLDDRIRKAAAAFLPSRGLTPAPEGEKGDLTLTYSAGATTQQQNTPVNVGTGVSVNGPGSTWINVGANKWLTKNVTSGVITVDLMDNATDKIVWRSYSSGQLQGKPTDENIKRGVEFFFKEYPPKKQ